MRTKGSSGPGVNSENAIKYAAATAVKFMNVRLRGISVNRLATFVLASYLGYCFQASGQGGTTAPSIAPGRIVPIFSNVNTIQPGEWVSIFGMNLASSAGSWNGTFPTSLGGTSVPINGKAGYLIYVSPTQINLQ